MIAREIYEVHMAYVNAEGFHASDPEIGGQKYPVVIDSRNNENDIEKTLRKAKGYLAKAESTIANRDDQVSYVYIIRVSDGQQIEKRLYGKLAELPEPEPEVIEPEEETSEGGEA